jgi:hypothetical protein
MWWKIGIGILVVLVVVIGGALFWLSKLQPLPVEPAHAADAGSLRTVAQGKVIGFANDYDTQGWLGIPYAAPPVGALRWRAPRPALSWSGTKQALAYGAMCSQFSMTIPGLAKPKEPVQGQEDCLFLNVFAPRAMPDTVPQCTAISARLPESRSSSSSRSITAWVFWAGSIIQRFSRPRPARRIEAGTSRRSTLSLRCAG